MSGLRVPAGGRVRSTPRWVILVLSLFLYLSLTVVLDAQVFSFGMHRFPTRASAPADCGIGEVYFNTANATQYNCTATNTWTAVGGVGGPAAWGSITGTLSDQTDLNTALGGKAATVHTHVATSISDSTVVGRDVVTAATQAAARTAIGAGTSSFDGVYASLTSIPATFAPSAHATSHSSGNTDPISHANLAGLTTGDPHTQYQQESEKAAANGYASLDAGTKVPIAQIPTGATGTTVPFGNDARFTDARTPTAHATSHKSGGGDAIKLDELAAPTDVVTLNASTTAHGLLPKLPNNAAQFLNGVGSWAVPGGGSDPWTVLQLGSAFATTSATAVDVTGLGFTPTANTTYEFEAKLMIRTAGAATVNPRVGFAWPTGMTDGVVSIHESQSATAEIQAHGNPNAAVLIAVGGLANNTQSWPARLVGMAVAGASPSGNLRLQLASESAGTSVSIIAGSFLRYRTVP